MAKAAENADVVYLDNSSTTRPDPRVVAAVTEVLEEDFGNPSSLHRLGAKAERLMENARGSVARLINADASEIYFTSGGTEANNWAIWGTVAPGSKRHIVSTKVEHPSVIALLDHLHERGFRVTLVGVDSEGRVDPDEVMDAVTEDTALVSVMFVQNEIGTIQDCREIGRRLMDLGKKKPRFHVDAVQGFARLPIDVRDWGVDLLTMSAHKIHGIKGAGALYIRKGVNIQPLVFGGGQESGMRSGTENMPGIVGFGEACKIWAGDSEEVMTRLTTLRKRLVTGIKSVFPEAVLHGPVEEGVAPHIVHFSFPGFKGESILHALEARNVFVSTGSACSSHKAKPSPVVLALGRSEDEALSSIRFSMSRYTTEEDIDRAIQAVDESLKELAAWRKKR
ncbi:MAG TPA: cysteine desulfurase [Firmicutes bacterium]|nr:cysteine desulfurase [Candidatus Fermentithermobacillaceae bacterium]